MIYNVYCVRDELSGFMTPTLDQSDASAMRNFSMSCDHQDRFRSLMSWKPSDFSLFRIATFNSESGSINPVIPPVLVCSGSSLRGDKDV